MSIENSALSYFWWFMLLSAFTGTSFSTAVINGFNEGLNLGVEIQKAIETTAATIPTQVSATWLNVRRLSRFSFLWLSVLTYFIFISYSG